MKEEKLRISSRKIKLKTKNIIIWKNNRKKENKNELKISKPDIGTAQSNKRIQKKRRPLGEIWFDWTVPTSSLDPPFLTNLNKNLLCCFCKTWYEDDHQEQTEDSSF